MDDPFTAIVVALFGGILLSALVTATIVDKVKNIGSWDQHACLSIAADLYKVDRKAGIEWSAKYCWPEDGQIIYPNSTR